MGHSLDGRADSRLSSATSSMSGRKSSPVRRSSSSMLTMYRAGQAFHGTSCSNSIASALTFLPSWATTTW